METSQAITADDLDLAPVFGQLDDETKAGVLEELQRGNAALVAMRDELGLEGEGLLVSRYPSGQTEVAGLINLADGKLRFDSSLRPSNFFSESPWHPGHAPRPMLTNAWDVEGAVRVMVRRLVGGHKYTIEEIGAEIEEQRYTTPVEAAAALASVCEQLAELSRTREPTVEAWTPPEDVPTSESA